MNILFLTIAFPERKEDRNIYTDLMHELKNRGHAIYVVTSRERRYKLNTEFVIENGLNVLRVKTGNLQKINFIEKGISTILIERNFIRALKKKFEKIKFDLILFSTPPITFDKVVKYIKNRDNSKAYLLLKDIFPQNAVDIGIIKRNSFIHRYFRSKETRLYGISDYIGCMSQANVDYIKKNNPYLEANKVEICPNSIMPKDVISIESKRKEIREKFNIPNEALVFVYGGNLGKPQGIDFLIDVLQTNKKNEEIFFLIVGNGTEYEKVKRAINQSNITNASLYFTLPKEVYDEVIQACDVGMIFLDQRFTIPNFPSRILTYMEFSMPVLAATDVNTDIGEVIKEGKFGLWNISGDISGFNSNIEYMVDKKQELKLMGTNARLFLEKHFTVAKSADIILSKFIERGKSNV